MQGLLADQNIQGHVRYLSRLLGRLKLLAMLDELHLTLATFGDCGLAQDLDDRSLWSYCQEQGWVLFTDNRTGGGQIHSKRHSGTSGGPAPFPC